MKKQILFALGVAGALNGFPAGDVLADIRLAISIPSGHRFYFESRPDFIYLDDYGFSISWGSPYDVIYFGNAYFIFQDGYWYRAYDYRGPWGRVRDYDLPPIIRRHRWDDIRRRRDIEYRRYDRRFWDDRFRRDRERWQGPDQRRGPDEWRRPDERREPERGPAPFDRREPDRRPDIRDQRAPQDNRRPDGWRRIEERERPDGPPPAIAPPPEPQFQPGGRQLRREPAPEQRGPAPVEQRGWGRPQQQPAERPQAPAEQNERRGRDDRRQDDGDGRQRPDDRDGRPDRR